ncbi:MAG: HD domain-containing protein [Candidatus Geothermarchaeales archaeon]
MSARTGDRIKPTKLIADPIYGFIGLSEIEEKLVDTPFIQRLRHISQLGPVDYVFPGASHSRFSHSLGAVHVAALVTQRLMDMAEMSAEAAQKLRLAALLHDVGHYPMSHVIEFVMTQEQDRAKGRHPELSAHLVLSTQLGEIIEAGGYEPRDIIAIMRRESPDETLNFLIDSDLDVDRLDFLARDAHFTGVAYGTVDLVRILQTIRVARDREGERRIVIEEKGMYAVEDTIIARAHMYQTVYYHKTVTAFELMLQRIYSNLMMSGTLPDLSEIYAFDVDKWFSYNDSLVWHAMNSYVSQDTTRELIFGFRERRPLSEAFHVRGRGEPYHRITMLKNRGRFQEFIASNGLDPDWVFFARIPRIAYVSEDPESPIAVHFLTDGRVKSSAEFEYSLLHDLHVRPYVEARLYTKPPFVDDVSRAASDWVT